MSNSTLAGYTRITKNRTSPRKHKIDTITIHCYVGQVTAKQGCDYFATTDRECSANYVVGKDGSIGISVEEKDRSWCSGGYDKNGNVIRVNGISGGDNDESAVTIEVASDTKHPYAVTDKAYAALIDLVTDICRRNGIKRLFWKGDKSLVGQTEKQNMTVHRWFANKACPGDYLYSRHGAIAAEVNKRLGASAAEPEKPSSGTGTLYKVQTGAFKQKSNAQALEKKLKAAGFDTYVVNTGGYYKVQVGAFSKKANAEALLAKLKAAGYSDAFITTGSGGAAAVSVKAGSKVRLKQGAKTYDGKSLASFVYNRDHVVKEIKGDRAVVTYGGVVVAAVKLSDLTLV